MAMDSPKWIILFVLVGQVFLYAAREPLQRALRHLGEALSGGFRMIADRCTELSQEMSRRAQELVVESGREHAEVKIEREFRRIEGTFAKDLEHFPKLQRELGDVISRIEADYQECGATPQPSPQWGDVVQAVTTMPTASDKMVQKVLEEIQRSVIAGEKRSLAEYRVVSRERHKTLSATLAQWKALKNLLNEVGNSCRQALTSTSRIDGYMARYEEIRKNEDGARRVLTWSVINTFVISALVMAVGLGGAFINFQLIALPMSELVPAGSRLMSLPVPSIAALVIVLMEVAAGIFVMEMLGITNLFPQLASVSVPKRRMILSMALLGLFVLASIESSLAILREQIVEAESALKQTLASGAESAVIRPVSSVIPLVGQAALGFILPWILAMVAIPLEMLVSAGGPISLMILSLVAVGLGSLLRLCAHVLHYATLTAASLYDAVIILPLQLGRTVRRRFGSDDDDDPEWSDRRERYGEVPASMPAARPSRGRSTMGSSARARTETTEEHEVLS
jgi:hypothetical protein